MYILLIIVNTFVYRTHFYLIMNNLVILFCIVFGNFYIYVIYGLFVNILLINCKYA